MIPHMRRLLLLLALAAGLAIPVVAFGEGPPSPATVAACQAEAAKLGNDAFVAKYGPTEPWGHCYAQHADATTTTTTTTSPSDDPAARCKAEYVQLGADGFAKKYGTPETYGNCLAAHGAQPTTTQPPKPALEGQARSVANALCEALAKQLGKPAFVAKFGREGVSACVGSMAAKARALVASCQSITTSKDAFRACLANAVGASRRR